MWCGGTVDGYGGAGDGDTGEQWADTAVRGHGGTGRGNSGSEWVSLRRLPHRVVTDALRFRFLVYVHFRQVLPTGFRLLLVGVVTVVLPSHRRVGCPQFPSDVVHGPRGPDRGRPMWTRSGTR